MLALALGQWVLVCLLAGLLTGLLQNIPMAVQPDGYVPAYVAAGGLTGVDPTEADDVLAVVVHHVTAMAAALLYGAVVFVLALLPTAVSLNGVPLVPHLVSVTAVTAFIYFFFERVALPRAGGTVRDDADAITEQWALSAFIYGVTLALTVPVLVTQL